ncbi:MAG: hypothetical protein ACKVIY_01325 [Acidimicrobiales bacterium]|jgi:hypothetical protein
MAFTQQATVSSQQINPLGDAVGVEASGVAVLTDVELDTGAPAARRPIRDRRTGRRDRVVERDIGVEDGNR